MLYLSFGGVGQVIVSSVDPRYEDAETIKKHSFVAIFNRNADPMASMKQVQKVLNVETKAIDVINDWS